MATEQGLHVNLTGDASDLNAAADQARRGLLGVEERIGAVGSASSRSGARLSALGRGLRAVRQQSYAVSVQLQDVAVQAAAGTSIFQVLGQQMPQLASAFGKTGAMVGLLASVAFPALGIAYTVLRGESKELKDELGEVEEALKNYKDALAAVDEMMTGFASSQGLGTAALADFRQMVAAIGLDLFIQQLGDVNRELTAIGEFDLSSVLDRNFSSYGEAIEEVQKLFEIGRLDKMEWGIFGEDNSEQIAKINQLSAAFMEARQAVVDAGDDLDRQKEALVQLYTTSAAFARLKNGINAEEQEYLSTIMSQIQSITAAQEAQADSVERRLLPAYRQYYTSRVSGEREATEANERYYQHMLALQNGHLQVIKQTNSEHAAGLATAYGLYADTRTEGEALMEAVAVTVRDAKDFAKIDLSSGVNAAAAAAAELAAQMNVSVEEAIRMINLAKQAKADQEYLTEQYSLYGQGKQAEREIMDEADPYYGGSGNILKDRGFYDEKKTRGGGKKAPTREELQEDLLAFEQSLMSEAELTQAHYAEQIAQLEEFRSKKLESQLGWDELEKRAAAARDAELLQQAQQMRENTLNAYSSLFGNLATIVAAGGDKTSKAVKGLSIAQGMLNSYLAYTQVLANPAILNPVLKQGLAYSTLAAGLAQVAAMRSTSTSGSSAAVAAAGGATTATASVAASGGSSSGSGITSQFLIQGDVIGKQTGEKLIQEINAAVRAGHTIELGWQ